MIDRISAAGASWGGTSVSAWRVLILATAGVSLVGCSTSGSVLDAGSPLAQSTGATAPISASAYAGELQVVSELPAPANTNDGAVQLLSENDVLEVDVFQVDDLDRTVQIDSTGRISLPLIGTVEAAGKTVRALEQTIEAQYGAKYLQSPEVTVFVKESLGQRVTVDGEVAKAGIYPVSSGSTLLQVLTQAGGFREVADPQKVFVYRDLGAERLVANYNVTDIRQGKRADLRVYGGDVVVVFSSAAKVATQNLKEAFGLISGAARLAVIP